MNESTSMMKLYIAPQDAIFNIHLAANLRRFSIAKARNRTTIPTLFLNQNATTSCNMNVKIELLRCDEYSSDEPPK
jgi:hypothetical protein